MTITLIESTVWGQGQSKLFAASCRVQQGEKIIYSTWFSLRTVFYKQTNKHMPTPIQILYITMFSSITRTDLESFLSCICRIAGDNTRHKSAVQEPFLEYHSNIFVCVSLITALWTKHGSQNNTDLPSFIWTGRVK